MRYLPVTLKTALSTSCLSASYLSNACRHIIVAACAFLLAGCSDGQQELKAEIESLRAELAQQAEILEELQTAHNNHRSVLDHLSEWEHVNFVVENLSFDVVEKAFEPLIMGEADLRLAGEAKPELIFVEWVVVVHVKDKALAPATYIQRVENGSARLRIVHPLPSHNIKKDQVRVEVKPTGWYMAHVAQLAE